MENIEKRIKEINGKINEIESLLMSLEKISGKLLESPIKQGDKKTFSTLKTNIYITRDEYADERDGLLQQINKDHRKKINRKEKNFKEGLLAKKGLKK